MLYYAESSSIPKIQSTHQFQQNFEIAVKKEAMFDSNYISIDLLSFSVTSLELSAHATYHTHTHKTTDFQITKDLKNSF